MNLNEMKAKAFGDSLFKAIESFFQNASIEEIDAKLSESNFAFWNKRPAGWRPRFISVWWHDPFDDRALCGMVMPFNRRMSARGFYTQRINRLTKSYTSLFSDILEGRQPISKIQLFQK